MYDSFTLQRDGECNCDCFFKSFGSFHRDSTKSSTHDFGRSMILNHHVNQMISLSIQFKMLFNILIAPEWKSSPSKDLFFFLGKLGSSVWPFQGCEA
jgi:hypothetical protein